jgi:hypothetical protein
MRRPTTAAHVSVSIGSGGAVSLGCRNVGKGCVYDVWCELTWRYVDRNHAQLGICPKRKPGEIGNKSRRPDPPNRRGPYVTYH